MPSIFDASARSVILARIERLTSSSQPVWGRMNVGQMLVHCDRQLLLALGEMTAAPFKTPVGKFPLKQLALYVLPTPKSVPTMPELRDPLTGNWEEDRARLKTDIGRVAAQDPNRPWPDHAAFGALSGRQWGLLVAKHLEHHLKQFGV